MSFSTMFGRVVATIGDVTVMLRHRNDAPLANIRMVMVSSVTSSMGDFMMPW